MSSNNPGLESLTHDRNYYFDTGNLHLLVDKTHFRVHSHFFTRDSPLFKVLLAEPSAAGKPAKGSTHSTAFRIEGTTPVEFATFLWVFYNEKFSIYNATSAEWISILKISCDFEFPSVKEFAIQNLETSGLGYPERIKVYQNHNVDPRIHILPLIVEMTMRAEPPSDGEAEIMGWATAATIFRARERLLNPNGSSTIATKVDAAKAILTVASDNSSLKVKADATGAAGASSTDSRNTKRKTSGVGSGSGAGTRGNGSSSSRTDSPNRNIRDADKNIS